MLVGGVVQASDNNMYECAVWCVAVLVSLRSRLSSDTVDLCLGVGKNNIKKKRGKISLRDGYL